jgi:hypothetical protein
MTRWKAGRSGSGLFSEYMVECCPEGMAGEALALFNLYVLSRRTTGLIVR